MAIPAARAVAGILGMFLVVPAIGVVAATWRAVLALLAGRAAAAGPPHVATPGPDAPPSGVSAATSA
jgi:hypothetical protein